MNSSHGPDLAPALMTCLPGRPLVAILPFTPCGDDPALRLLGNQIGDRLRDRLAKDPATQAILISSDFLSQAPPHAIELICRELRVGHLISGKCHPTGDEPSLYVELTDARDWLVRWADFYGHGARAMLAEDGAAMNQLVAGLRGALAEQRLRSSLSHLR